MYTYFNFVCEVLIGVQTSKPLTYNLIVLRISLNNGVHLTSRDQNAGTEAAARSLAIISYTRTKPINRKKLSDKELVLLKAGLYPKKWADRVVPS